MVMNHQNPILKAWFLTIYNENCLSLIILAIWITFAEKLLFNDWLVWKSANLKLVERKKLVEKLLKPVIEPEEGVERIIEL